MGRIDEKLENDVEDDLHFYVENEKFNHNRVKKIIQSAVSGILSSKKYDPGLAEEWCKQILDTIKRDVLAATGKIYKFVINAVLCQQSTADMEFHSRCFWDQNVDALVSHTFQSNEMICHVVVYGLYSYFEKVKDAT